MCDRFMPGLEVVIGARALLRGRLCRRHARCMVAGFPGGYGAAASSDGLMNEVEAERPGAVFQRWLARAPLGVLVLGMVLALLGAGFLAIGRGPLETSVPTQTS